MEPAIKPTVSDEPPADLEYILYSWKKMIHQKVLADLSPYERHRLRALKKLQLETIYLDTTFHRKVYDLEREFQPKYEENYLKRRNIINGEYEPTKDECYIVDADQSEPNPDEPATKEDEEAPPTNANASAIPPKGIPNFWLNVFKFTASFCSMVKQWDEEILKHLTDVRAITAPLPDISFTLEFHFTPNDYFENPILTKKYFMTCAPNQDDPFSFDGPEIYKSQGCQIQWKPDKDVRYKAIKKKDGQIRMVKGESFFNFFYPPDVPTDITDLNFDFISSILERDYEIGHYIKEHVIPKAVLYFMGEIDDNHEEASDLSSNGSEILGLDGEDEMERNQID